MPRRGALAAALVVLLGSTATAQRMPELNPDAGQPYDVRAGRMEAREGGRRLVAEGGVHIRQGRQLLAAERVEIDRTTDTVIATGRVVFVRWDGTVWKGERLVYNFRTGEGDFGRFMVYHHPYYLYGEKFRMVTADLIELEDVTLTTCEGDNREFQIRAPRATLEQKRYATLYHATAWLGPVPVAYVPYYRRDLQGEPGRWDIVPGYSSRLGAFLIATYNYGLTDTGSLLGRSSLHLYSERGVGVSQNVLWRDPPNRSAVSRGNLEGFFIQDQKPFRNAREEEERRDTLTEDSRYRVRLRHQSPAGERGSLFVQSTYMSDPFVEEDFFRRDYRTAVQPENRASWLWRGDRFLFSVLASGRLNDFYESVDRLPELSLTIPALRLGELPLYYESVTVGSSLRRVYPEIAEPENYDALRLDTRHMLYLPHRYFGFLAFTPRAGWRGTWYSTTYADPVSTTNIVTRSDSNGVPTTVQEVLTTRRELGADFRSLPELGAEISFKAYKVLDEAPNVFGRGLRHVVEPYARHTWIPVPDLMPERLPQFDAVDRLAGGHTLQFGLRNKLQTRRGSVLYVDHSYERAEADPLAREAEGMDQTELRELPAAGHATVHDLVNADVGTLLRLDPEEDEDPLGPLYANVRLWPARGFRFDFKALVDLYGEGLTQFDGQLSLASSPEFTLTANYLYQADRRDQMAAQLRLFPKARWSLGLYARYDLEQSRIEEHSYFVQHRMNCIGWGVGVRHEPGDEGREDDFSVWVQLWLLAMPYSSVSLGG
ncbi:MAG: LPS assembly protein LptD [Kiritimatiellae bacterium]|nr:LPS assembly protein LptD [Kiritimatiellia bacterium]